MLFLRQVKKKNIFNVFSQFKIMHNFYVFLSSLEKKNLKVLKFKIKRFEDTFITYLYGDVSSNYII